MSLYDVDFSDVCYKCDRDSYDLNLFVFMDILDHCELFFDHFVNFVGQFMLRLDQLINISTLSFINY
jgi:hypothetical protein